MLSWHLMVSWCSRMIVGMVELLTRRQASGWAHAGDDAAIPLSVRARIGETILARIELEPGQSPPPATSPPNSQAHPFCIEFPTLLDQNQLVGLIVESSRRDCDLWCALPQHLKIWGSYLTGEPPLLPSSDRIPQLAAEDGSPNASQFSFWSNEAGGTSAATIESRPVFVLGSARSGTTVLCAALQQATRYQGFAEGHVLDVAIRLVNAVNAHFEKKDPYIPPAVYAGYHLGQMTRNRLHAESIELLRRLTAGYKTPYFFDKTPTYQMVASVPILAQAWPGARFIFMKRRGLENMASRIRKFAEMDFAGSCRDWAIIMSGWRSVRSVVPNRFVELDQRTLADDPDAAATRVGALLDLEPAEVSAFANVLRHERPEVTDPSASIIADLSELHWSAHQIETFRGVCGAEMDAYGYTYDAKYCC